MAEKKLVGKVIIVSGGTKGVGRAVAEEFARHGATVVIAGRDEEAARKSLRLMKTYGSDSAFIYTDLHDVSTCSAPFEYAYKKYGRLDGFFNYAGVTYFSPLDECDERTFDEIMDINFKACFFCCQNAIKYMRMSGGGSIVITGSPHAWSGEKDRCTYACSKGALLTLVEHIAHHYSKEQIRCNLLTLGWTPTEGEVELRKSQGMSESELRDYASSFIPMGRMSERSDYIDALIYLMSDGSKMTTGSNLRITGGLYM